MPLKANNIDEVVVIMDDIIQDAMQHNSRLGYFAALYRTVTIVVRDECNLGLFDDNERMRQLDTIFANRYFAAYDIYHKGRGTVSDSWVASFDVVNDQTLLILQHLLLGMNAHIALDLGIATAEVAKGELTESLKSDFYRLNHILTSLIDVVQQEIAEASPLIYYLDRLAWRIDEKFVSMGINLARDNALEFAEELIALPKGQWTEIITARDEHVANMSRDIIANKRFPYSLFMTLVNQWESKNARQVVEIMSNEQWQETVAQRVEGLIQETTAQGIDLGKRESQVMRIPKELRS